MSTALLPETAIQFMARMLIATREGHQIHSRDAQRLNDIATFGRDQQRMPTMPEERRISDKPLDMAGTKELVTG